MFSAPHTIDTGPIGASIRPTISHMDNPIRSKALHIPYVTFSFEDHRPLYDWFLESLEIYSPRQIEFARLNLTYTILGKRKLKILR